jgi:hypothetical protein
MSQSKPQFRTVEVRLAAPYEGWTATMKAEGVPARVFIELQSGNVERAMNALKRLVVSHNFLTDDGAPAEDVLDAPMDAITDAITKWSDAVAALPPR